MTSKVGLKQAGNEYLQFTYRLWMTKASTLRNKQYTVSEIATNTFPYIYLEYFWNNDG